MTGKQTKNKNDIFLNPKIKIIIDNILHRRIIKKNKYKNTAKNNLPNKLIR